MSTLSLQPGQGLPIPPEMDLQQHHRHWIHGWKGCFPPGGSSGWESSTTSGLDESSQAAAALALTKSPLHQRDPIIPQGYRSFPGAAGKACLNPATTLPAKRLTGSSEGGASFPASPKEKPPLLFSTARRRLQQIACV